MLKQAWISGCRGQFRRFNDCGSVLKRNGTGDGSSSHFDFEELPIQARYPSSRAQRRILRDWKVLRFDQDDDQQGSKTNHPRFRSPEPRDDPVTGTMGGGTRNHPPSHGSIHPYNYLGTSIDRVLEEFDQQSKNIC